MEPDIIEQVRQAVRACEDARLPAEVVTLGRAEAAALRRVVSEQGFSRDTPLVGLLYGMRIRLVDEPSWLTIEAEDAEQTRQGAVHET